VLPSERKFLKKLCLGDIGLIWDEFLAHRMNKKCYVVMAKNCRQTPIGWALLFYDKSDGKWTFSVYVKQPYRRKRIGTKIYRKMLRSLKLSDRNIHVYRHDTRSTEFYDKVTS
jgi:GNAT superfamily N-acetyltransferase